MCNIRTNIGERKSNGRRGNPTPDTGHSYQCGRLLLAGRHGNQMVHFGKGIRVLEQFRAPLGAMSADGTLLKVLHLPGEVSFVV